MNSKSLLVAAAIAALTFCLWGGIRINAGIHYTQNCGGYIERAANANTVELATRELARAVEYMERNELKSGYTSVLWRTPDEDIGFWYANTTAALAELRATRADATPLEKSNVLMKLRESLTNRGEKGDHLNVPEGIAIYPSNVGFFWWAWLSFGVTCIASIAAMVKDDF